MSKRKTYSREYKIGAIQMVDQKGMTTREAMESDPLYVTQRQFLWQCPSESFFAIMKRELDLRGMNTKEQTAQEIFELIVCFYNRKRIHSALGYISPEEHELHWKTKYSSRIRKKHMPNLA